MSGLLRIPRAPRLAGHTGAILLPVVLMLMLLSVLSAGGVAVARLDLMISDRFVQSVHGRYAAEGALAVAVAELRLHGDWTPALSGLVTSPHSDGAPEGTKAIVGGGTVVVCCGSGSVWDALTRESSASPVIARRSLPWRPYLWTSFATLAPGSAERMFVAVFVQNDEADAAGAAGADTNGAIVIRAYGLRSDGLRRAVEALLVRVPADATTGRAASVRVLRWREVR